MKCPSCGSAEMTIKVADELLAYGGQSLTLHDMRGRMCAACGETIWDEESYRRYTEAQTALLRAVKGDVGGDIRRIRKKLRLTQTELSTVVGIGKVAFSRYERGETKPPAPFLNQFSVGRGDYTKERDNWLGEITLDDAISQIKAEKNKAKPVS